MTELQSRLLAQLYQQYAGPMRHWARQRLADGFLAQDMVQETFLLACCKAGDLFYRGGNPAGWLYRTLQNLIWREWNRQWSCVPNNCVINSGEDCEPPNLAMALPPGLRPAEREILLLRLEQRRPYGEIAARLGISRVTCRQRYSRALRRCRQLLMP